MYNRDQKWDGTKSNGGKIGLGSCPTMAHIGY